MKDIEYYGFVWDDEKEKLNIQKHGISFKTAVAVFRDPYLFEYYDYDHSNNQQHYVCIGTIMYNLVLFVVNTDRDGKIRIISARKATKKERNAYYENAKRLQTY